MRLARWLLFPALLAAGFLLGWGYHRWWAPSSASPAPTAPANPFYCPMHPNFTLPYQGDCPICGMRLVRRKDDAPSSLSLGDASPAPLPDGAIHLSPYQQQLIGVRYAVAELASPQEEIRTTGIVALDESCITRVHARVDGFIEQVFADYTGRLVEKGQPLLTLYSPQMLASQQEFLLALRSGALLEQSPLPEARAQSSSLIHAARRRLELWNLSPHQIDEIARRGEPLREVTLFAPSSGFILSRNAFPNQRVTPETELYSLADLSRVWVFADIFEADAPLIRTGAHAVISLPYAPGRRFPARVSHIQPQLDPSSRTLKARLELANPNFLLKPEMYVQVAFPRAGPPRVVVPEEAVIDTGDRQTVFLDRGNGHFEPRSVRLGARFAGRVEVLSGLAPGERIVASSTFLIDSESRLRSAAPRFQPPPAEGASSPPSPPAHAHD